jgi:protein-tyrosine phosphatase
MRVLFVCTGNLCRSPLAERLTTAALRRGLGPGAMDDVHIASAGLEARAGAEMDPRTRSALARLGGDASGFTSRPFAPGMAESADLVLTMSRQQRTDVLRAVPRGLRKTFTLLEAADLVGCVELDSVAQLRPALPASVLALRLDAARRHHRDAATDDIPDPIGRSSRVHAEVADQIAAAVKPLVAALLLHTGTASASTAGKDQRLSA